MEKYAAKITSKGQVTIPKQVRERLGRIKGDYLVIEPRVDHFVARKAAVAPTDDFQEFTDRISERFAKLGIDRSDVKEAVQWAREES